MKQQDTLIFDDDDILNQIQNKLNTGSSNISNNQSIFAVNISGIQNIKNTSGFINPNFLRQNQIKEGKEDIIHSIYNEDTLLNILNESINITKTKLIIKEQRKGGPVSIMSKIRKKKEKK